MTPEMAAKIVELIMKLRDEEIIYIKGRAFAVRPASDEDVERVCKGNICMD